MEKVYLICNAHIDPVWQWEIAEGKGETLSTFRVCHSFAKEFPGFVFNHNEALLYSWVKDMDPELFNGIKEDVKNGSWHIMAGAYLQPDCNMPLGETIARVYIEGKRFFRENFGVESKAAINFDPFGHSQGLVQILSKCGYSSYTFVRPMKEYMDLAREVFIWQGFANTQVFGRRMDDFYNSRLGKSVEKIKQHLEDSKEPRIDAVLWGVGDHGGGPSKKDLLDIEEYKKEMAEDGVEVVHSTLEDYFDDIKNDQAALPIENKSLNPWGVGCYSSQQNVKAKFRKVEASYYASEKFLSELAIDKIIEYPTEQMKEALDDLLFVTFHDALPGSAIKDVERMVLDTLGHAETIINEETAKGIMLASEFHKSNNDGSIPLIVVNPNPYEVTKDIEGELMLADQGWGKEFLSPVVYQNGERLPSQSIKERSSIPLNWRKAFIFHAKLKPFSINKFDCYMEKLPKRPVHETILKNDMFVFSNKLGLKAAIDRNGALCSLLINDEEFLSAPSFKLSVFKDDFDPWGMNVTSYSEKLHDFVPLSKADRDAYLGFDSSFPPVHVIEDGEVETVVEAYLGYSRSRASIRYHFYKNSNNVKVDLHLEWLEKMKMAKLSLSHNLGKCRHYGETLFGENEFSLEDKENVSIRYLYLENDKNGMAIYNNGVYGSSFKGNEQLISLLHSPIYCCHPIKDRVSVDTTRMNDFTDIGEHDYEFILEAGTKGDVHENIARKAEDAFYSIAPLARFPKGKGKELKAPFILEGNNIAMTSLIKEGDGFELRLFNSAKENSSCSLSVSSKTTNLSFLPYEAKTIAVSNGIISVKEDWTK